MQLQLIRKLYFNRLILIRPIHDVKTCCLHYDKIVDQKKSEARQILTTVEQSMTYDTKLF